MRNESQSEETISLPVKAIMLVVQLLVSAGAGFSGYYLHAIGDSPVSRHDLDNLASHMDKADDKSLLDRETNRSLALKNLGTNERQDSQLDACKERYNALETRVKTLELWNYDNLRGKFK